VALALLCLQAVLAREVSRTGGLNQDVYKKMVEIQTLIDEGDLSRARKKLERLQAEKLSDYELAQTWFLMGYLHYRNEDYPASVAAYKKVLVTKNMPLGLRQNVVKTLAQLSVAVADYPAALTYLDRLIKIREESQPEDHALRAQVLYLLEDIDGALVSMDNALRLQQKREEPPKENWLQLKNALLYQRNDYRGMLAVTNELIALYPRDRYLLSKAAIHGEMGDTRAQLALMEPLYERGSLASASHKVNLASLYLLHGIPYKAGVLLDSEIKAERIEATERHLEMLAQAWLMSAETERAIKPLQQAAHMGKDGNGYINLARTYISLWRWPDAETSLKKALEKSGLQDTGGAQLMLGMVQFNQKNFRDARRSFALAGQDPKSEKLSRQWLQHLEREEEKARLAEGASG
jgi:tetratricopeptide (TPR) repeat protein